MAKHVNIIILVILITGAAVWGFQQTEFFTKLPRVFSGASGPPEGGPPHGERNGSMPEGVEGSGHPPFPEGGPPITLASWLNVLAYLAISAFVIMLTYYAEFGIRTYAKRREPYVA